jgi:biotin operon repressor
LNRADRMLSVLKDGRTYSRREIMERAGWFMTNNAAAELRARGYQVEHRKEKGNDVYQLVGALDEAAAHAIGAVPAASSSASSNPPGKPSMGAAVIAPDPPHGRDGDVLTLFGDAA